ncbi:hypothetical protein RRG08_000731 [Elysia crispata]|uniref:Uncharacterized protein n=1 Tax=Elysia crispata TaxID=231223 RepID=A0AAE1AE04_9GAST|nr:hypothetical protein RRG08_000731 [Elysia crispata]
MQQVRNGGVEGEASWSHPDTMLVLQVQFLEPPSTVSARAAGEERWGGGGAEWARHVQQVMHGGVERGASGSHPDTMLVLQGQFLEPPSTGSARAAGEERWGGGGGEWVTS